MTIIGIVLGALVVAIILFFLLKPKSIGLVKASITATSPLEYSVQFQELHEDVKPVEYVWLCLLLASKLLFNMGNDAKQTEAKQVLHELIAVFGRTDFASSQEILRLTEAPLDIAINGDNTGKTISAIIEYQNIHSRSIATFLPATWYEFQFPHTLIASVYAVLPKLDEMLRKKLQGSFARMAELYTDGADSASMKSMIEVPQIAFMDSKVI